MASTKDSGSNWAVTRTGQAALFWGALLLVVSILDAIGKWDVLSTLQSSLPLGLEFLVEPGAAVILVSLALGTIWLGSPSPDANPQDAGSKAAIGSGRSVLREASIPLFLALVCGLAVGGFEWRQSVGRPVATVSRRTSSVGPVLSGTVHHRARTSTADYRRAVAISYNDAPESSDGENFVARWVPVADVALDQTNTADAVGQGNPLAGQLPADPRPAIRAYAYDGALRILKSGEAVTNSDTLEHRLFGGLDAAHKARDWHRLARLSEDAIHRTPEWLTPYCMAGEAYANLGQVDRAIAMLEYVKKQGQGNPDYDSAVNNATEMRELIRRRYGL